MTARERGRWLVEEGEAIFQRDLEAALTAGDYNLAVRRAQEVVELSLKGALAALGVEYPKAHHVGDVFAEQAKRKLRAPDDILKRIERVSLWLSEARAPAFYLDRDFTREDAEKAREDAAFVLEAIKELLGEGDGER